MPILPFVKAQSLGRSSRQQVVVRATAHPEAQPRRAALALLAATVVGLGVVDTAMASGAPKSTTGRYNLFALAAVWLISFFCLDYLDYLDDHRRRFLRNMY